MWTTSVYLISYLETLYHLLFVFVERCVIVIAGDFHYADLKAAPHKFHQHVKWATRGVNTLDKVYSNIKQGYKARPLPHLGQSNHLSLLLIPACKPLRKTAPIITKTVTTWPEDASQQLQDCFDRTNWEVFEHQDLELFTDSVLCYIKNCIETITVGRFVSSPTKSPGWIWRFTDCLRERNIAFRSGDSGLYSAPSANLRRGIREAKADYRRRIEDHLDRNNSRQVWQGIRQWTNCRTNMRTATGDLRLAEELNTFFARFGSLLLLLHLLRPTYIRPAAVHSSFRRNMSWGVPCGPSTPGKQQVQTASTDQSHLPRWWWSALRSWSVVTSQRPCPVASTPISLPTERTGDRGSGSGHHTSTALSLSTGSPQGLCAESPTLLSVHPWLRPPSSQQHYSEIRRWHHNSGSHLGGVCI